METGKNECSMKGKGVCPMAIESVLINFRNKWSLPVLITIGNFSKLNFNLIKNKLKDGSAKNISPKVLSKKLKDLEKSGFVRSRKQSAYPFKVKYSLTDKGEDMYKQFLLFNMGYEEEN